VFNLAQFFDYPNKTCHILEKPLPQATLKLILIKTNIRVC
jgi:hypothetical protein